MSWFRRHFTEKYENGNKGKPKSTPPFNIDPWIETHQAYARNMKALALKGFIGLFVVIVFSAIAYGFSLFSNLIASAKAMNPTDMYDIYSSYSTSMSSLLATDFAGILLIIGVYASVAHLNKMSYEGTSWDTYDLTTSDGLERVFDIDKLDLRPVPIELSQDKLKEKLKNAKKGLSKEEQKNVDKDFAPFFDKENPIHAFKRYRKDNTFYYYIVARAANLDSLKIPRPEKHQIGFGSKILPHCLWNVVDRSPYTEPYEDMEHTVHYCIGCGEPIPDDQVNEAGKAICQSCGTKEKGGTGRLKKVRDAHPILIEEAPLFYITNMPCGATQWLPTVSEDATLKSLLKEPSLMRTTLDLSAERIGKAEALDGLGDKQLDDRVESYKRLPKMAPIGSSDEEKKGAEAAEKKYDKMKIAVAGLGAWGIVATILALL